MRQGGGRGASFIAAVALLPAFPVHSVSLTRDPVWFTFSAFLQGLRSAQPDSKPKDNAIVALPASQVLGKYHPHGDTAVYNALVRLAQDFSMNAPLVRAHSAPVCGMAVHIGMFWALWEAKAELHVCRSRGMETLGRWTTTPRRPCGTRSAGWTASAPPCYLQTWTRRSSSTHPTLTNPRLVLSPSFVPPGAISKTFATARLVLKSGTRVNHSIIRTAAVLLYKVSDHALKGWCASCIPEQRP